MSNFKKAREARGFSQKQISITLGVSQPTVSEWESGKKTPSGKNLKRLMELLDCSSDYLLGLTDVPESAEIINVPPLDAEARINQALEDIGLIKPGEELSEEDQLRIARFLIANKEFILGTSDKIKDMED